MKKTLLAIVILIWGFGGPAQATLITIGTATHQPTNNELTTTTSNLIWDDVNQLLWLDYSAPYGTWTEQTDWVASLSSTNVPSYTSDAGYNVDWGSTLLAPAEDIGLHGLRDESA